jgi:hypothetical protein
MQHRTVSSGVDALVLRHAGARAVQARREAGIGELVLQDPGGRISAVQHLHLLHLLGHQQLKGGQAIADVLFGDVNPSVRPRAGLSQAS